MRSPLNSVSLGGMSRFLALRSASLIALGFVACSRGAANHGSLSPSPAPAVATAESFDYSLCEQIERGETHVDGAGGVVPPQVLHKEPFVVPSSKQGQVHGLVVLEATISCRGEVRDVVVKEAVDREVGQEFAETFRKWRFRPGILQGRYPVPTIYTLTVNIA